VNFVLVTEDFSGLGFAIRLQEEGHDVVVAYEGNPEELRNPVARRNFSCVGLGIAKKVPLRHVLARRESMKSSYFLWDGNHHVAENELLRQEQFHVFGGGQFSYEMEHDRAGTARLMSQYGLEPPPTYSFRCTDCAENFLRENPNKAYVLKPNHGESRETWVPQPGDPAEANRKLQAYLRGLRDTGTFVLQEFVQGIESNVEVWFVRGEPKFAVMALENKRKLTGEAGDLTGCAFDYVFPIALDCKAVLESIGKLYPIYRSLNYTGFGDANVILAQDKFWFLEKCERFGYNAHPNYFWNLNRSGFGESIAALVDGTFKPDCRAGFGASVTMYTDEPAGGGELQFPNHLRDRLYFWDIKQNGCFETVGYDFNVLIAMSAGDTMPSAWSNLMATASQVHFPNQKFRADGGTSDYAAAPMCRYEAMRGLNYI
jgi:phosphoribosylamine-glycine ligase